MTTKNCFLEENHPPWAQSPMAEAAEGLQVLAPLQPAPFSEASQVLPHFSFSAPSRAGSRRAENGRTALPQHLPPGAQSRLPSPGRCRSLPAVPALPREQGHADTASPCPGHARKLCLTLQSAARRPGTKNRSCARLDVFLSAGYTPSSSSSRSFFSIGGTAGCSPSRGWFSTGRPAAMPGSRRGIHRDWALVWPHIPEPPGCFHRKAAWKSAELQGACLPQGSSVVSSSFFLFFPPFSFVFCGFFSWLFSFFP